MAARKTASMITLNKAVFVRQVWKTFLEPISITLVVLLLGGMGIQVGASSAASSSSDLWRYKDTRGVMHFVQGKENVPAAYLSSARLAAGSVTQAPTSGAHPVGAPQAGASGQAAASETAGALTPPATAAAAALTASTESGDSVESDIAELEKHKTAMVQQAESLNQFNPLSQTLAGAAGGASALPSQLQWIGKVLENPRFQKLATALQKPEVMKSLQEMAANPYQLQALGAQLLMLLFLYALRWKLLARCGGFLGRLLVKLGIFAAMITGMTAISVAVYGRPLLTLLSIIGQSLGA